MVKILAQEKSAFKSRKGMRRISKKREVDFFVGITGVLRK